MKPQTTFGLAILLANIPFEIPLPQPQSSMQL